MDKGALERAAIGTLLSRRSERGSEDDPLLSVTQDKGVIPQDEAGRRNISSTDKTTYWRVYPDDIVYNTMRMWQGASARSDYFGIVSPAYTVCCPAAEVSSRFLSYALKLPEHIKVFRARSQGMTSDVWNLRFEELARIELQYVPGYAQQERIVNILSSVDDAIEKTQAVIDQVQVIKRSLMQVLLRRGLPGRHTRFKQTEIGEVPDGWRTSRIGEIASCDYGTSDSLQGNDSGIPILRMGNLMDGRVSLDDVKYLAAEKVPEELLLSSGDVLFNRTNSAELVGKVAVFDHQVRASFASYLLRLRVEQGVGCGFWLSYLLNTETVQRKLRATATLGVSQVNINRKSLLGTAVPVPPVEEQGEIVSILNSVSSKLEVEQKWVGHLKGVKSSLMSVLLTGELRVTPDTGAE